MKKKLSLLIVACLTASLFVTACSSGTETAEAEGAGSVAVVAETPDNLADGLVSWAEDCYVLEGSEGIDYTEDLVYDTDIVTGVIVDDSDVDLDTPGGYTVSYTLIVDDDALGEEPIEDVVVCRTVEVVDEDRAEELTAEGETVWYGNNAVVEVRTEEDVQTASAVTDDADVSEDTGDSTASDSDSKTTTSDTDGTGTAKNNTSGSVGSSVKDGSSSSTKSGSGSSTTGTVKSSNSSSTKNSTGSGSGSSSSSAKNSSSGTTSSSSSSKSGTSSSSGSSSSNKSSSSSSSSSKTGSSSSSSSTHTHSYTSKVTKAATCTTAGVRTYACSCGDSYTKSIDATGHSYSSKTTKSATCTSAGTKTYTCSKCGNSYTESIAATGHTWVSTYHAATGHYESVLVKAAYDEKVLVGGQYVCKGCGWTTTSNLDMIDHVCDERCAYYAEDLYETVHHDAVYENQWVQDTAAYTSYTCSVCGATK